MKYLSLSLLIMTTTVSCTLFKTIVKNDVKQEVNAEIDQDSLWNRNYKQSQIKLDSLLNSKCKNRLTCTDVFNCDREMLDLNYEYNNERYNKLIKCTIELSISGNKSAEIAVVRHYDKVYNHQNPKYKGANSYRVGYIPPFGQLRSPEAFKVAMKYARHGKFTNDIHNGGGLTHSGLQFLTNVIYPMISTIDGLTPIDYYKGVRNSNLEKYKSSLRGGGATGGIQMIGGKKYSNKAHKDQYDVLLDAWKSGKIVLKKYGE